MIFCSIKPKYKKGFTLIELLVSITIFAFMTALLTVKYTNFNQSMVVVNSAYDVALLIRQAQNYGLNVKTTKNDFPTFSGSKGEFNYGYGAHFDSSSSGNTIFSFFLDSDDNGVLTNGSSPDPVKNFSLKKGVVVSDMYIGDNCESQVNQSYKKGDIVFKRPYATASIYSQLPSTPVPVSLKCIKIILGAPDGSKSSIVVRQTGQISIEEQ